MGWFDDFIEGIKQKLNESSAAGQKMKGNANPVVSNPFAGLNPGGSVQSGGPKSFTPFKPPAPTPAPPAPPPQQSIPSFDVTPQEEDPNAGMRDTQAIWDRLGQNFSFDPTKADTSAFDEALAARMDVINKAKGSANSNFAQSDANLAAMHGAFQNDVLSERPDIMQQYDNSGSELSNAFGGTVDANKADQAAYNAQRAEMLQRLGIAPAANQRDTVNESYAKANTNTRAAEDVRLAENSVNKTGALDQNTNFANAIGAEGVSRRSNLNSQLQDILGKLDGQGADYQANTSEQKMNYLSGQEDKSYQRFLQDRNFDIGLLGEENNYNRGLISDRAKSEAELAKVRAEADKGTNQISGFDGLIAQTPPDVQQVLIGLSSKMDMSDTQKVMARVQKEYPPEMAAQIWSYLNKRDTLGTTNKFEVQ